MKSTFEGASQLARKSLKHGRTKGRIWKKTFVNSIRDNPKMSLLVAATLGAVIAAWRKRK